MTEEHKNSSGPKAIFSEWMKVATQFWGTMTGNPFNSSVTDPDRERRGSKARLQESWDAGMNAWRIMGSMMADPEVFERVNKGAEAVPDVFSKMLQSTWSGMFQLQMKWFEKAVKMGESSPAYSFENLDQDALRLWSEIYEKEFRQYLHVPQLGLTRFYQERAARLIDRGARFQTAIAEFLQLIYLPMEKSVKVLQQEMTDQAEKGEVPENSREYYQRWIKILEGHFMTLFKSPEYTKAMGDTLTALEQYATARNEALGDMLSIYPMPTQEEMDELYKEIYLLKKRIRNLEKLNKP